MIYKPFLVAIVLSILVLIGVYLSCLVWGCDSEKKELKCRSDEEIAVVVERSMVWTGKIFIPIEDKEEICVLKGDQK